MSSPPDPAPVIDVALLRQLLELEEDLPLHRLVLAARRVNPTLPSLVLSALERDGQPLGTGSRDELRRCRARAAIYAEVQAAVSSVVATRVVKGPSLARWYPPGLLRPVGDLDLRVANEQDLWQAVQVVAREWPVEHIDVSIAGAAGHFFVCLVWPSEDPPLDPYLSVDLQTAAFGGNVGPTGVHGPLPDDQVVADVLALAEERFQRPFHVKDVVDTIALSQTGVFLDPSLPEVVEGYQLAPELAELIALARSRCPLPVAPEVEHALAVAAARESSRRAEREPGGEAQIDVSRRLGTELPVHGMLLRRTPRRQGMDTSQIHRFDGGHLLVTPVADYLLVGTHLVDPDLYDAALVELERVPVT